MALDDLRQLVCAADRQSGIDLLESFEHFDRRGQVGFVKRCLNLPGNHTVSMWHGIILFALRSVSTYRRIQRLEGLRRGEGNESSPLSY